MEDEIVELEGYRVVAIAGEGPAVADSDGNVWIVGGDSENTESPNKLERDYAQTIYADA